MVSRNVDTAQLKQRMGRVGVWTSAFNAQPADVVRATAGELEDLGYGAVWLGGEGPGSREMFGQAAILLAATERLVVASGIANIWARDGVAAATGAATLDEAWPGRFVLGLGASHSVVVAMRGQTYAKPYSAMRDYLDAMDASPQHVPTPEQAPRVLAALRPRMLELSAQRAEGAHPYFVPVEHTAVARKALGPEPLLAPEQAVVLDTDPDRARATARRHMEMYLQLPNYVNNLHDLGWSEADTADGGSDGLVDAIVAWGDADTIADRVRAHHQAGADHVSVQAIAADFATARADLRTLAPVLTAL